jgi:hypothetical protein
VGLRDLALQGRVIPNPCCLTARTLGYISPEKWPTYYEQWKSAILSPSEDDGRVTISKIQYVQLIGKHATVQAKHIAISYEKFMEEVHPLMRWRTVVKSDIECNPMRDPQCNREHHALLQRIESRIPGETGIEGEIDAPQSLLLKQRRREGKEKRAGLSPKGYDELILLRDRLRRAKHYARICSSDGAGLKWAEEVKVLQRSIELLPQKHPRIEDPSLATEPTERAIVGGDDVTPAPSTNRYNKGPFLRETSNNFSPFVKSTEPHVVEKRTTSDCILG